MLERDGNLDDVQDENERPRAAPFPWAETVAVAGLVAAAIVAALVQKPVTRSNAALIIISRPGGAAIYIDGVRRAARTPATVAPLAPGSHTVQLVQPGRRRWTCVVGLAPGQTVRIEAVLEPTARPRAAAMGRLRLC